MARGRRFKKYRTKRGFMGGAKSILTLATVGAGSYMVGEKVSQHVGISPMIPSAVLGYFAAGWKGLLAAFAVPMILGASGSLRPFSLGSGARETVSGVVWA